MVVCELRNEKSVIKLPEFFFKHSRETLKRKSQVSQLSCPNYQEGMVDKADLNRSPLPCQGIVTTHLISMANIFWKPLMQLIKNPLVELVVVFSSVISEGSF
jgi:hypothetical protein